MGQKLPKRTNKKQWLKLFVLTFAVADAAGIYIAHKRLTAPVPGSVEGELLAYSDRAQATVPHVVSVVEPGAANVAVNDSALRINSDLRFAPDRAVPALDETPAPKQLAKVVLPSPAFGPDARKPAAVALAAPTNSKQPTLVHTTPAPQTAAVSLDKSKPRLTAFVPVTRQISAQTAAFAPVHAAPATSRAVPSPKLARMAASAVQTSVRHSASRAIHRNAVQLQAPSFTAAFADIAAVTVNSDQGAAPASDWTPATSDFQQVATAPSAVELLDSTSAPAPDHAATPSAPAPSSELPATSPAPDAAG